MKRKKILITGAAGAIGTTMRGHFAGRYELRSTDIETPQDLLPDERFIAAPL